MEVYRNAQTNINVAVPLPGEYEVAVISGGGRDDLYLTPTDGNLTVPLTVKHTQYDGEVRIEASAMDDEGNFYTFKDYVDVVTPLFTAADIDDDDYDDEKVPELERLVRKVIEAYTGQRFGPTYDSKRADRIAGDSYNLAAPMLEFKGVSTRYLTNSSTLTLTPKITNGGMTLTFYDVKTDTYFLSRRNSKPTTIFVEGIFGYDRVPGAVKEAALLIAGLWGCEQAIWRDRYIGTMNTVTASVKIDGINGAYAGTGSVTADQLLDAYKVRNVSKWVAV